MEVPTTVFYLLVLLVVHTLLCVVIVTSVQFHRWRTCSSLPTKYRHLPRRTKLANFGGRQTRRIAYYLWHWWVERVTPSLSNHLSIAGEDNFSENTPDDVDASITPALLPESDPQHFPVALTAWAYVPVPFAHRVVPIYEVTCKKEMETAFRHLSLHFAIGVDVEHHQDRSYQGQTCLIQLGTRDCCFLLDPLVLPRGALGRGIRTLFAEPARVLIFHSPRLDLKWLNRDFGLNSVACTVLDTQKLPAVLGLKRSLSHLWELILDFPFPDKKRLQISNWAARPLSEQQLIYAATDACLLPFIADALVSLGCILALPVESSESDALETPDDNLSLAFTFANLLMGGIPHPSGGWKTSPLKSPAGFLRALDAVKGQVDSCSVTTILRCLALRKINRLPSDVVSGKVFIRAYMEDMDVRRRLMNLKQLTSLMGCRLAKQVAPACDWVINEMKWMDPMPIWHTPSLPTLNPTHFNDLAVVSHVNQAAFLPAFLKSVVPLRTLTLDFDDRCYVRDYKRCLEGKYLPMADPKTEATFAVLHAVRDIYARRLDEGPTWLLPTSVLAVLSREGPTTEEEVEEIYRSCAKEAGPPDLPSRMKSMVVLSILWAQANLICSEAAPAPQKTPISHYRPFKSMQEYLDCLETFPQKIRDQVALMPPEKRPRFLKYSERFAAQKAVYENFQILSPNGSLLCHCDRKKVDWYLRKNLAQTIDATSIQLKFEPAARSLHAEVDLPDGAYSDGIVSCENGQLAVDAAAVIEKIGEHKLEQWKADLYYVSKKDNHCVVCGVTQHFLRFHVIPSCYRQHFPEAYKSHGSHDVVLLCVACHQTANDKYQIMKAQLSLEYHVPLQTPPPPENRLRSEARKALHALKRPQIPPHRREELRGRVVVWVQANQQLLDENLSPEDKTMDGIPEAAHRILSLPEQQSPSISHGEAMVVAVASDIDVFIKRWRKYFLDVLEPGFMPVNWTVEHKCARHFGEHSTFNPNKPTNDTGGPVDLLDEFKNEQAELPSAG